MSQKRSMPNRKAIAEYWMHEGGAIAMMGYGGESRGYYDDDFMHDECWACGLKYPNGFAMSPDRCHVISRCDGGSDECSNLVLMCRNCHQQSEMLPSETFWDWIKSSRKNKWRSQYDWMSERLDMVGLGEKSIMLKLENGETKEEIWKDICKRLGLNYKPLPEHIK
jgi:hypothetical protein